MHYFTHSGNTQFLIFLLKTSARFVDSFLGFDSCSQECLLIFHIPFAKSAICYGLSINASDVNTNLKKNQTFRRRLSEKICLKEIDSIAVILAENIFFTLSELYMIQILREILSNSYAARHQHNQLMLQTMTFVSIPLDNKGISRVKIQRNG